MATEVCSTHLRMPENQKVYKEFKESEEYQEEAIGEEPEFRNWKTCSNLSTAKCLTLLHFSINGLNHLDVEIDRE